MSRRGSSLFPAGGGGAVPSAAPPMANPGSAPGGSAPGGGGGSKRQSVVLQPMAGGIGLVDFDSDYESEEETPQQPKAPAIPPGQGPGGAGARPMVGGFAAAAYEAARAYHYAHKDKKKAPSAMPKRGRSSNNRPTHP